MAVSDGNIVYFLAAFDDNAFNANTKEVMACGTPIIRQVGGVIWGSAPWRSLPQSPSSKAMEETKSQPPRRVPSDACVAAIEAFVSLPDWRTQGTWVLERLPIPIHVPVPACMRYALKTFASLGLYQVESTLKTWLAGVQAAGGTLAALRKQYSRVTTLVLDALRLEATQNSEVSLPNWERIENVPGCRALGVEGPAVGKALFGNNYDASLDGYFQLSLDLRSANFSVLQRAGLLGFHRKDGLPAGSWTEFMARFTTNPLLQTCKRLRVTVFSRLRLAWGPAPRIANKLSVALLNACLKDVLPAVSGLDINKSLVCRKHEELIFAWPEPAPEVVAGIRGALAEAGVGSMFRAVTYTLRALPYRFVAKADRAGDETGWELKCGTREKVLSLLVKTFHAEDSPLRRFFMNSGRPARYITDEEWEELSVN